MYVYIYIYNIYIIRLYIYIILYNFFIIYIYIYTIYIIRPVGEKVSFSFVLIFSDKKTWRNNLCVVRTFIKHARTHARTHAHTVFLHKCGANYYFETNQYIYTGFRSQH